MLLPFRLIIYPTSRHPIRGGACFQDSRGRGIIMLKCESNLLNTKSTFVVSLHSTVAAPDGKCTFTFITLAGGEITLEAMAKTSMEELCEMIHLQRQLDSDVEVQIA